MLRNATVQLASTLSVAFMCLVCGPSPGEACSLREPISVPRMLAGADAIVRATADDYVVGVGTVDKPYSMFNLGAIRFTVRETLKGTLESPSLVLPGFITARDDFNDAPVPYPAVRMAGRRGNCVATDYRRGAEFLLFLQRTTEGYRVFPEGLGPVNEQVVGGTDAWVQWVKVELARRK